MNATKLEKTLVTLICLLAAIFIILGMVNSTRPQSTAHAASGTLGGRFEHSDLWTQPVFEGTVTIRFSDCFADKASGDLYVTDNWYCRVDDGTGALVEETRPQSRTEPNKPIVEPVAEVHDVPVVDKPTDESPVVVEETPEPSELGNPGNLKPVGHAGEDPNGRGTMPTDNAGGNGNGEHGNQGTNEHANNGNGGNPHN